MPRTTSAAVLPLLAVPMMLLALPGNAVAGPPEGVSGRMVFDEVADGLRKYRKEKDPEKRIGWLEKLAPTKDPRVAMALYGLVRDRSQNIDLRNEAVAIMVRYFASDYRLSLRDAYYWWEANEADLRRRAKQLPE